jgi:hypothetical protein
MLSRREKRSVTPSGKASKPRRRHKADTTAAASLAPYAPLFHSARQINQHEHPMYRRQMLPLSPARDGNPLPESALQITTLA